MWVSRYLTQFAKYAALFFHSGDTVEESWNRKGVAGVRGYSLIFSPSRISSDIGKCRVSLPSNDLRAMIPLSSGQDFEHINVRVDGSPLR